MTGEALLNGAGLCCALGPDLASAATGYRAGRKVFVKEAGAIGPDGLPVTVSPVFGFHQIHNPVARLQRLLAAAMADLADQCQVSDWAVPMRLCLPAWLRTQGIGIHPSDWPGALRADVPVHMLQVVWSDQATFLAILAATGRDVAEGRYREAIVATVDTLVHAEFLDALAVENRLLARTQPHGVIPSEGAAALRVTAPDGMRLSAPLGWIDGHWSGYENQDVTRPDTMLGAALARPFKAAVGLAPASRLMIDLNGERWRSEEIGVALARANLPDDLMADFETPPLTLGHCGTAAQGVMAALAMAAGPVPAATDLQVERSVISCSQRSGARDVIGLCRDVRFGSATVRGAAAAKPRTEPADA